MSGDFVEPLQDDPPLQMLPVPKLTFFSERKKEEEKEKGEFKNYFCEVSHKVHFTIYKHPLAKIKSIAFPKSHNFFLLVFQLSSKSLL